jgi:pimeloyl-ACP methyl ester carboxylesterase
VITQADFTIDADGVRLAGDEAGSGSPVVLLHGLTATRRYVVMGSRALDRAGHRVIAYDARGHGQSAPAPDPDRYEYSDLAADLLAVLDGAGVQSAVLAGASMGAHTAVRMALTRPERVTGLVLITPAFDPAAPRDDAELAHWDALARGLREGGVEGFVAAYGEPEVPPAWRDTVLTVLRQRLSRHADLGAVADALEVVPRSRPFEAWDELAGVGVPTVVVASRDDADPGHPYAVGEAYAEAIDGAQLVSEPAGKSPLAWQGGQLSQVIARLADTAGADR